MKFIVDANLSPRIAARLCERGHDAVAVRDVGLLHASDDEILARAIADGRVIVSHDTDFGAILAFRRLQGPSFILLRSSDPIVPDDQADMILANLDAIESELLAGAIAVFARGRLRIRRLPVT